MILDRYQLITLAVYDAAGAPLTHVLEVDTETARVRRYRTNPDGLLPRNPEAGVLVDDSLETIDQFVHGGQVRAGRAGTVLHQLPLDPARALVDDEQPGQ